MCGNDNSEDEASKVCEGCVGESHLRALVGSTGENGHCSYCEEEGICINLEELADHVERAFDDHYVRTAIEPEGLEWTFIKEGDYNWERDGEEAKLAILNAADFSEEQIAEDVREVLADRHSDFDQSAMGEELPFEEESYYSEKSPGNGEFPYLWDKFERELKTEARFFSTNSKSILDRIFEDIESQTTTSGGTTIIEAGPGEHIDHLFRARVFQNQNNQLHEALSRPWLRLGTPPAEFASAGRMNANGIAVFYGARETETALAEVRPPVGSHVALARFNILRPLRLLDLNALPTIAAGGSVFNPTTIVCMQRAGFLEILIHKLAGPVMPHEEEARYLPTQVVAEYLATQLNLDGIVFPSVQAGNGSTNVVLFHHAARVQEHSLPPGTEVSSNLYSGDPDEPPSEYSVWEETPNEPSDQETEETLGVIPYCDPETAIDSRPETLSVELECVEVRYITAVSFQSDQFNVTRTRVKRNPNIDNML